MSTPAYKFPTKVQRPHILNAYLENTTAFISQFYATGDARVDANFQARIKEFVTDYIKEHVQKPQVEYIRHIRHGEAELTKCDLLTFTNQARTKIVTPSGSVYKTVVDHPSAMREQIVEAKAGRAVEKKAMFMAKQVGDTDKANFHNNNQNLLKIGMNSVIGAMGTPYSFMSDQAGFNGVTSTSRYLIMSAYAQTERLLEGNFYFNNLETVINHLVICLRTCPSEAKIMSVVERAHLRIPDWSDVLEFINHNYRKYHPDMVPPWIGQFLYSLPSYQLAYIYYYNNLKHLIQSNQQYYRPWIQDIFNPAHMEDPEELAHVQPEDLFKLDGDLIIMLSTAYGESLPLEPSGKKVGIYDTVTAYPEIAKKFACVGKYIERQLSGDFQAAFELFLDTKTVIPLVTKHKNMYRDTVIFSDTDSVGFTTKNWLKWYQDSYRIDQGALCINALVVYWLTKAIAYILRTVCTHRGALGEDVNGIVMKNEFFYPVMTQSPIKKHYAGMIAVQEGVILPKIQSDIKGLQFRSSRMAIPTAKFTKDFLDDVHKDIIEHGQISAKKYIQRLVAFELEIFESIKRGEVTYLSLISVKNAEDYAEEEKTIYFNYTFWEAVFGEKYGSIIVPTKCYALPLTIVQQPAYLEFLSQADKEMHERCMEFLKKYPHKKLTRIPINPISDRIPEELTPIINIRQVVYDNVAAVYLFLRCLGINVGNTPKSRALFSEIYGLDLSSFTDSGSDDDGD